MSKKNFLVNFSSSRIANESHLLCSSLNGKRHKKESKEMSLTVSIPNIIDNNNNNEKSIKEKNGLDNMMANDVVGREIEKRRKGISVIFLH